MDYQPGIGPDYWICALTFSAIGSNPNGLNVALKVYILIVLTFGAFSEVFATFNAKRLYG